MDAEEKVIRLVTSCPDQVGIVAAVSRFITEHQGWLVESNYFTDSETKQFFMRNEIKINPLSVSLNEFRHTFAKVAEKYSIQWYLRDTSQRQKVVLLASHASHCLADILHRWHSKELDCDISCVIANHENLRSMVEWHEIPFFYVPIEKSNKVSAFEEIIGIIDQHEADTIVLARFMQIIPSHMCEKYMSRMINIHHSFLPSFKGANPYQKAYERGVKLIGATSHYVTSDLDEGPIIEQDVIRVGHRHRKDDLVRLGRDVEKTVLARALRNHLEDRVLIHGHKTVVFD
jgi:formyltetrahydrofolate deformylase